MSTPFPDDEDEDLPEEPVYVDRTDLEEEEEEDDEASIVDPEEEVEEEE